MLGENFGNPSSANAPGRRAKLALDEARDRVASGLGCEPGEVGFCSGGTESATPAAFGAMRAAGDGGRMALCSATEHPAVLKAVESVGGRAVPVRADGVID